jgi:hypothetical protein
MAASERGEYSPVAPNDAPEGQQKNRRIEIMLIEQGLAEELAKPKPRYRPSARRWIEPAPAVLSRIENDGASLQNLSSSYAAKMTGRPFLN